MTRHIIIDTDTASDDAIALILALRTPNLAIDAITIVAGNVSVEQGARNAGIVLDLCDADIPIHLGAGRPLIHQAAHAGYFHGIDGLGDVGFPPPARKPSPGHAVPTLIERFAASPGGIDLVTLGPLTNLALALRLEPRLAGRIRHCTIMGGNPTGVGNVTPDAEYNIWCDPHAASIVLDSGMNITLVGWELSRAAACLTPAEIEALRSSPHETARFAIACSRTALRAATETQAEPGLPLPDPIAMAIALDPAIATTRTRLHVTIPHDGPARGATLTNPAAASPASAWPIEVCHSIDIPRFKALLFARLQPPDT